MNKNISGLGIAYLILIAGVVIWFGIVWTRTCNNNFKLQQNKVVIIERLEKENTALIEENTLLKQELKELKEQLDMHNSINFSILSSLVEEYSKLKNQNVTLQEENTKVKSDLDKVTSKEKTIIMKIN